MSREVDQYRNACAAFDFDEIGKLRHPDYQCYYPQSGERFTSHESWVAAHREYDSHFPARYLEGASIKGGRQRAEVSRRPSPVFGLSAPLVQISGAGDLATIEGVDVWPDGKTYCWVRIVEFKDGLVWRETEYFAEPFDPPEWRAPFTEVDARRATAE